MIDQAAALRKMMLENKGRKEKPEPVEKPVQEAVLLEKAVKIYAVVSGKGGVGKSNLSVNLAIAMAEQGKRVLLMDADIGMTNADILLGMKYEYDLFDYLDGHVPLSSIVTEGPLGIQVVSGGAGLFKLETLDEDQQQRFIEDLIALGGFEVLIIDNGAGISKETLSFITFAHEVILVTTPEPTAITDAYRVLKAISHYRLKPVVKLVVNRVSSMQAGEEAFEKLQNTAREFLTIHLESAGFIFDDVRMARAIMEQHPVILSYPNALSAMNIRAIASTLGNETAKLQNVSSMKQLGNRIRKIFGT